jgi:hypothetical protein
MRRRLNVAAFALLLMLGSRGIAHAAPLDFYLFQWIFHVDGAIYDSAGIDGPASLPSNFSDFNGNVTTLGDGGGLGLLQIFISTPGPRNVVAFFDHEIREALNDNSNETALAVNLASKPAHVSYEGGEPGFSTPPPNVYTRTLAGSLANSVSGPTDVALAMGWAFTLGAGETGRLLLSLSETPPAGGFYLQQIDPHATAGVRNLYFSSTLSIDTAQTAVPEPATLALLGSGLAAARLARLRGRTLRHRRSD